MIPHPLFLVTDLIELNFNQVIRAVLNRTCLGCHELQDKILESSTTVQCTDVELIFTIFLKDEKNYRFRLLHAECQSITVKFLVEVATHLFAKINADWQAGHLKLKKPDDTHD